MFCWYKSASDASVNKKVCMKVFLAEEQTKFGWYSNDTLNPTPDDFKRNGLYCKSGIAYQSNVGEATCVKTSSISF